VLAELRATPRPALCLRVADDLAEVVARHCKGVAVAVAELGAANLSVRHTLVVHV